MAAQLQQLHWDDPRSITDVVASVKESSVDYLLLRRAADAVSQVAIEDAIRQHASADIIVFVDPRHPARKRSRVELLPAIVSLIAASPEHDRAALISGSAISKAGAVGPVQTWHEFVVKRASTGTVAFVEVLVNEPPGVHRKPPLTAPSTPPNVRWLRDVVPEIKVPSAKPTALTALQAGLFLLADLFDDSHSCSQSIEGEGHDHTGDYWHAILHRREPDYANSKYWFRHVGRHPIFGELASTIEDLPVSGGKATQFQSQVTKNREWDPFGFVDLCAAAEHNQELKDWCEGVQYEEMLLLLEHSYREAKGVE